MKKIDLDRHELDIPCPSCSQKTTRSIGGLKREPAFTCACGARITVDSTQLQEAERRINQSIEQMFKGFGR